MTVRLLLQEFEGIAMGLFLKFVEKTKEKTYGCQLCWCLVGIYITLSKKDFQTRVVGATHHQICHFGCSNLFIYFLRNELLIFSSHDNLDEEARGAERKR